MGLLKRLFSIGSKKNKKQRPIVHDPVPPVPHLPAAYTLRPNDDEDHEAAVGRLLRSTSARYTETSELNYATLPPLPHPINNIIQTPASSTISLASTTLSSRGTYNVTVHGRRRHASTEFPLANRGLDDHQRTPKRKTTDSLAPNEDSRVLRLRSDPSVASLLELYDEHGKLSADAFSNSPPSPPKERAQCRRSGSTLRQLLGAYPSVNSCNNSSEGDISWAERYLAETESNSSRSSLMLRTPQTPEFSQSHANLDLSFASGDISTSTWDNPAISSMEVEVSITTDNSQDFDAAGKGRDPYLSMDPATPQRASQVFGFLTQGKQSRTPEESERPLPDPPSTFSSPSDENVGQNKIPYRGPNNDFTFPPPRFSLTPSSDETPRPPRPRSAIEQRSPDYVSILNGRPLSQELHSAFSDDSHDFYRVSKSNFMYNAAQTTPHHTKDLHDASQPREVKVLMTGPTKVILTTATPLNDQEAASRFPRGPRALPGRRSSSSAKRRRSALVELSNSRPDISDPPSRSKQSHSRTSSQRSTASRNTVDERPGKGAVRKVANIGHHKENQLGLSVRTEIPSTPLRSSNTTGSHSLLKTVVQQSMFRPPIGMTPSPASSSEMSPMGRQIMLDVRQQRMKARGLDRERSGRRVVETRF